MKTKKEEEGHGRSSISPTFLRFPKTKKTRISLQRMHKCILMTITPIFLRQTEAVLQQLQKHWDHPSPKQLPSQVFVKQAKATQISRPPLPLPKKQDQKKALCLLSGHCGLNFFILTMGRMDTATCECGAEEQTRDHILQSCPHLEDKLRTSLDRQHPSLSTPNSGDTSTTCKGRSISPLHADWGYDTAMRRFTTLLFIYLFIEGS